MSPSSSSWSARAALHGIIANAECDAGSASWILELGCTPSEHQSDVPLSALVLDDLCSTRWQARTDGLSCFAQRRSVDRAVESRPHLRALAQRIAIGSGNRGTPT